MFKTRITELFGIRYPIIQGGMQWVSRAELAAAVSNAGGLGIITAATFPATEGLRQEIRKLKSLTSNPFGVNINLFPTLRPVKIEDYVRVVVEEGVKIVETSGRSPEAFIGMLHQSGVKVMHKCVAVKHAQSAERVGCDAVVLFGFEGGGHIGMDDITTMVLIPSAVNALKIPVVAAGGIADARGFVAALALGAEAILMGSRFMLTKEAPVHTRLKEWMVKASETSTVPVQRGINDPVRAMNNTMARKVLEMEKKGAKLEDLVPYIRGENAQKVLLEGDLEAGVVVCSEAVGIMDDIPTCKELIDKIISEAQAIVKNLGAANTYQPLRGKR